MICTVSTVKDARRNVNSFVSRNLASGVDHMFILVDAEEDPFVDLSNQKNVTLIPTDSRYWGGERPDSLNTRQKINANVINCLLSICGGVRWLFGIDGDECLEIDKSKLLGLGLDVRYVRLLPLEAVSQENCHGEVKYFKRLLGIEDLQLLATLGVIKAPRNHVYFRGHVMGKVGVRPSPYVAMQTHKVAFRGDVNPVALEADFLRLLHYESYCYEEFVRKWSAHLEHGISAGFRAVRKPTAAAVLSVLTNTGMSGDRKTHYLRRIYKRELEDDVRTLVDLGFLNEMAQELHEYSPISFSADQAKAIATAMPHLLEADKTAFDPDSEPERRLGLLRSIRSKVADTNQALTSPTDHGPAQSTGEEGSAASA